MSKRTAEFTKLLDPKKAYPLKEAIDILKKTPCAKFDETVDICFNLNVDPKLTDQVVRGSLVLPHGTGKKCRVLVFCKGEAQKSAKEAGADYVGADELIEKVNAGFLDFEVAISTSDMMKNVSRLGRILGPRGLMPTPKTGTVTDDVSEAVRQAKGGKIDYKADKQGDIHVSIGKLSFTPQAIYENAKVIIESVFASRPSSAKGQFIKRMSVSSTMGPGMKLDTTAWK